MGATGMWDPIGECAARARAIPAVLRSLEGEPDGGDRAQALCDELLADLDVLLARCTGAMKRGRDLEDLAVQVIQLKWMVYCVLRRFLTDAGWSELALAAFAYSARCDLRESRARLHRAALSEAPTVRMARSTMGVA